MSRRENIAEVPKGARSHSLHSQTRGAMVKPRPWSERAEGLEKAATGSGEGDVPQKAAGLGDVSLRRPASGADEVTNTDRRLDGWVVRHGLQELPTGAEIRRERRRRAALVLVAAGGVSSWGLANLLSCHSHVQVDSGPAAQGHDNSTRIAGRADITIRFAVGERTMLSRSR